jgi:hypothetical protein
MCVVTECVGSESVLSAFPSNADTPEREREGEILLLYRNAKSTHCRMHSPRFHHQRFTESFVGECTRPHIAITPLACYSSERRWRWKMCKLLHVTVRRAICSRVARVWTRASFDAEQKNRHQTHHRSHSARMPNIRRARARTLSTHPDSRSRGECSAMCGGSTEVSH